jgi:D-3-phosphoglycerate dehydrogenase
MKPGSLLINTSRGSVIDEADLFSALKSNHLAGAGLDVFSKEPYDGELTTLQHVVITPHVSTLTQESRAQMEIEATENIINFFKLPMEK